MVVTGLRATYAGLPRNLAYSYQGENTVISVRAGKFALASPA
ncbi:MULTISPECIES: hypothetical protein [unclassified Pseudomonas]